MWQLTKLLSIFFLAPIFTLSSCTINQNQDFQKPLLAKALLATRYDNLDSFKSIVNLHYSTSKKKKVKLKYTSNAQMIICELKSGLTQEQILNIKEGTTLEKLKLLGQEPYAIRHRQELAKVFRLARRFKLEKGVDDVAFYDLALASVKNISNPRSALKAKKEKGEKGYINTFNHITAQTLITILFSKKLADFIGDKHELQNMPELVTGRFSQNQLIDTTNYPTDNYVDLVNNELGQQLGILLKHKYKIKKDTVWTTHLLSSILNDIQDYYSFSFNLAFSPFTSEDWLIKKYTTKLNEVLFYYSI